MFDLMIKNGVLVTPEGTAALDIAVSEGKIARLAPGMRQEAAQVIDASGLHIFPGVIDPHVHFNQPGRGHWETIAAGSAAFAAGGGTLYLDMPINSDPPTCDAASLEAKRRAAQGSAHADFALYGGLTPSSLDRVEELARAGAMAFKAFTCYSGEAGLERADDYTLYMGMAKLSALGLPLMVHAENADIIRGLTEDFIRQGRTGARDYFASRPIVTELAEIAKIIQLCRDTGCRTIIAHVSTARGALMIAEARADGADIHCETIGHYLVYTQEDCERIGALSKCSPPIRPAEGEGLWSALEDGCVDFISSDHSPCPPQLKAGDYMSAWGGIAGCQSGLELFLGEGCKKRGLALGRAATLFSSGAARVYSIPGKGKIEVGYDADFALVDLNARYTLAAEDLLYLHPSSLYTGRTFGARVKKTILRGRLAAEDGRPCAPPLGQFIAGARYCGEQTDNRP